MNNDTASYEEVKTGGVTVYLGKETISQNTINAGYDTLNNIQKPSPENIIQFNSTTSNVD